MEQMSVHNPLQNRTVPSNVPFSGIAQRERQMKETNTHFLVCMKIPGMKKEDLKIELRHHKQLVIRGCYGDFFQTIMFPVKVKSEDVKASYTDNMLQVLVPKAETAQSTIH